MRPGIARWLSGLLASVLLVAAASGLDALLEPWGPALRVLYVLAILPVALVWGTGLAVFTAVLSAVVFDYLFVKPVHSLALPDLRNAVALGVYLVTAVVTGVLAARLHKTAQAAARLSDEQAALRRVATLIARGAPPEEVFVAVSAEIGQVLSADFTSMSRYDRDGTATVVGIWSRTSAPSRLAIGDRRSDEPGRPELEYALYRFKTSHRVSDLGIHGGWLRRPVVLVDHASEHLASTDRYVRWHYSGLILVGWSLLT